MLVFFKQCNYGVRKTVCVPICLGVTVLGEKWRRSLQGTVWCPCKQTLRWLSLEPFWPRLPLGPWFQHPFRQLEKASGGLGLRWLSWWWLSRWNRCEPERFPTERSVRATAECLRQPGICWVSWLAFTASFCCHITSLLRSCSTLVGRVLPHPPARVSPKSFSPCLSMLHFAAFPFFLQTPTPSGNVQRAAFGRGKHPAWQLPAS